MAQAMYTIYRSEPRSFLNRLLMLRSVLRSATRTRFTPRLSTSRRALLSIQVTKPDIEIPRDVPFSEYISKRWDSFGDKAAIIDSETGSVITYRDLPKRIDATAASLHRLGIKVGDIVAIHLPNCPEYALVFHAVAKLGCICSTANPVYTSSELNHLLEDSGARFLVTTIQLEATAREAAKGTKVESVLVKGEDGCIFEPVEVPVSSPRPAISPEEQIAVLPYSSGTTGLPKGVMLSHLNLVANIAQNHEHEAVRFGMQADDVVLGVLPFFHIYGMIPVMNLALATGSTLVTMQAFEPKHFLTTLEKYGVSVAPLVPPLVLFLAKHPMVRDHDISKIRLVLSGAAPLDADLQTEALSALGEGAEIRQGYGMTEMSPVSHLAPVDVHKLGSVGKVVAGSESKVVGEDGRTPLGPNQEGEICVRGPQVMVGYLNRPEATAETVDEDGFLHTGDVGYFDEEGHFFITERVKELVKVKGLQVAPAELEGVLLRHPAIADCAVIGIPDERAGERPKAFVVLKPSGGGGGETSEQDIKDFIKPKVAAFKQLGEVEFVEAIPKSASGKILKRVLRDQEKAKREAASANN